MIDQFNEEKEFYKWLGQKYQTIREQKGLKQKDVAEAAGVAQGDVSKFENRGKKLSAYRILLLLKAVGVTMDELIGDSSKKKLTFTLNGDEVGELSNGEKKQFVEKAKIFFKMFFSREMMRQMAHELEAEELAREAARECEQQHKPANNHNYLNHDPALG